MSAEVHANDPHFRILPERPGVDARHLIWLACAALLLLGSAIAGLHAIYRREAPVETMPPPQTFPRPRVQADDKAELMQTLERQRQELSGYRWANKEHTLVKIPIERAMQLIAAKGARAYAPIQSSPAAPSSPEAGAERAITPSGPQQGKTPNSPAASGDAEKSP